MPKNRHIHADLIHAWAEGAEIEFRPKRLNYGSTFDWHPCENPDWHENFEYRVKRDEELSAEQITAKLFLLKHGLGNIK